MADNPYAQFDSGENPYAKFDPGDNPYSKMERPSSYLGMLEGAGELGARGINAIAQQLPESIRPVPRAPQPIPYQKLPFVGEPSNAGLYEAAKGAVTLPADVMAGKVNPLSDEGIQRAWGAAQVFSPGSPATAIARRPVSVPLPADEIKSAAASTYEGVRGAARATPLGGGKGVGEYVHELVAEPMAAKGPREAVAPETWGQINNIAKAKDVGDLVDIHQNLSRIVRQGKGQDVAGAGMARDLVANEIERLAPGKSEMLRQADKEYAIGSRAQDWEQSMERAALDAATRTGPREGTNLRRMAKTEFLRPEAKNVSPAVEAAAKRVATPGLGPNILRGLSVADPTRGYIAPMAALMGGGYGYFNPVYAGLHLGGQTLGYAAGRWYDKILRDRAAQLSNAIRNESPTSLLQLQPAHNIAVSPRGDISPLLSLYPFQQ